MPMKSLAMGGAKKFIPQLKIGKNAFLAGGSAYYEFL